MLTSPLHAYADISSRQSRHHHLPTKSAHCALILFPCGADGGTVLLPDSGARTQAALQGRLQPEVSSHLDTGRPAAEQPVTSRTSQDPLPEDPLPEGHPEQSPASHNSAAQVDDLRAQLAKVL